MDDVTSRRRKALREAGRYIVRSAYEATGEVPEVLAEEITSTGDVDYLDRVASRHGLDGMPDGYGARISPEWEAVFEGTRDAIQAIKEADESE